MVRDIEKIKRDLESSKNNDIIYKKAKIKEMFKKDPDLNDVLGEIHPMPLNHFIDPDNPTEEEKIKRQQILDYNESIKHERIIDFLKLNGIQKEVVNFIMFDIDDYRTDYSNRALKDQYLVVMCLVHEDDMDTEYGITRTDLLSYIVKDLLSGTNSLGMRLMPESDRPDIIDDRYYTRTLRFKISAPNTVPGHMIGNNKYDRFN